MVCQWTPQRQRDIMRLLKQKDGTSTHLLCAGLPREHKTHFKSNLPGSLLYVNEESEMFVSNSAVRRGSFFCSLQMLHTPHTAHFNRLHCYLHKSCHH